jgi:hypothetical protein
MVRSDGSAVPTGGRPLTISPSSRAKMRSDSEMSLTGSRGTRGCRIRLAQPVEAYRSSRFRRGQASRPCRHDAGRCPRQLDGAELPDAPEELRLDVSEPRHAGRASICLVHQIDAYPPLLDHFETIILPDHALCLRNHMARHDGEPP